MRGRVALDVNGELFDVMRSSPCPYASRGRYVLGARWDGALPAIQHLNCLAQGLVEEAAKPRQQRADAVVAVSQHDNAGMTYQQLCRALFMCLVGLHNRDPLATGDLVGDLSESLDSWDFTFRAVAYFVPVFSSIYDTDHPRRSDVPDTSFFLFQPEYAFRRFNISGESPRRRALSDQVLSRFAAGGRIYPIESVYRLAKSISVY